MRGNLDEVTLADLLFLLGARRRCGRLVVRARGDDVQLHLTYGRVMVVTSSNAGFRLGRTLLRLGHLSQDQLTDALREQEGTAERRGLGSIVTERGWLTPHELARCVEDHAVAVLARVIDVDQGSFVFTRTDATRPRYPLNIAADRLLIAATRRSDELATLSALLPPRHHRLVAGPHAALFAPTLAPAEAAVMSMLGQTDVSVDTVVERLVAIDEISAWRTIISLRERGVLSAVPRVTLTVD